MARYVHVMDSVVRVHAWCDAALVNALCMHLCLRCFTHACNTGVLFKLLVSYHMV